MLILLDQHPANVYFNGSGFPLPEKGSLRISRISVLIRFNIWLSVCDQ